MLYRNPDAPLRVRQPGILRGAVLALRERRRRRRTELELRGLSVHLRRDLGLDHAPFDGWGR